MEESHDSSQAPRVPQVSQDVDWIRSWHLLRGPKSISRSGNDENSFYGWAQLALEGRVKGRYLESRTVYGNLFDHGQQIAILRAVGWRDREHRDQLRSRRDNGRLVVPARFISLPAEVLREWLAQANGLDLALAIESSGSWAIPLKGLRVERDYTGDFFERAWQSNAAALDALNQYWASVWDAMAMLLKATDPISDLQENFWSTPGDFVYASDNYKPFAFP